MLNNFELDRLDNLEMELQELQEYRMIYTRLPYSVTNALKKHEMDLKREINRLKSANKPVLTVRRVESYILT